MSIDPAKDVDGFHPVNLGKLLSGEDAFYPCTPHGILVMLERSGVAVEGRHVVVVGRSNIVGKPLAALLMQKRSGANATVTVCHSRTTDLAAHTRRADILVAAAGQVGFITGDMVGEGAVVVDVGINRVDDPEAKRGYRLVGDVEFEGASGRASRITPVPGGVGPMTIAMLLTNTVHAARRRADG
jgi:methylenetetrahydrofolate dehydrogenase (NADP+)/methenyltetrahydrofolate cyclohydrolase